MSILGVNFNNTSYKSKFGAYGLHERNQAKPKDTDKASDTFTTTKRRNKKNSILTTLGLIAATAFATYKGKNVIKGGIDKITKTASSTAKKINFSSKFPNLSQAGKSLIEALKTPAKPFMKLGQNISKFFHK